LKTIKVIIRPSGRELPIDPSLTLLTNLQKHGLFVESVCGGKGTCGKCRVRFIKGAPRPSETDGRHLTAKEIEEGWRLACQVEVGGEAEIFVPPPTAEAPARILAQGRSVEVEVDPEAKKYFLRMQPQKLDRPIGDVDLVLEALSMGDLSVDLRAVKDLPRVIRDAGYQVTVTVAGGEITRVEPGDTSSTHFGLAVDLGTSTLVVSLVDLSSGAERAVSAALNPQRPFGADVISRIQYCREKALDHGAGELRRAVADKLADMIGEVCEEAGIAREDISEAIVVGNPTMQHIFVGLDPSYIGVMPYAPAICRKVRLRSGEACFGGLGGFPIQTPPNLSGFIGSDIVGGIISQGFFESHEIQLLIDLGTNAEIVLGNKERLLVSNAAAGPAFEGAKIECGMIGLNGAIDRVWFDEEDVRYGVIGDVEAAGICGSGLVDAIASLLDLGILDPSGKMNDPSTLPAALSEKIRKRLRKKGKERRFWLSDKVYISQKDVRQVQAAKAAVAAGIEILTRKIGVTTQEIATVMIAGAFGSYVNPRSAMRIGLIPSVPIERVISVGNSALAGAKMYLLSRRVRELADKLHEITELHELSVEKGFMEAFISNMSFR
jgi:uncharacterized 2Fe-2S/4Fe-4S cluster protein (DUF4445 family)